MIGVSRAHNVALRGRSEAPARCATVLVGVQEPLAVGIDPEVVLRGLRSEGYFIWPSNNIEPFGTGQ